MNPGYMHTTQHLSFGCRCQPYPIRRSPALGCGDLSNSSRTAGMLGSVIVTRHHEHRMTNPPAQLWRRVTLGVLLMVWWLAQCVALDHAVEHAPAPATASPMGKVHAFGGALAADEPGQHNHSKDWGHDEGTTACDLLADLLGGSAVASAPPVMPGPPQVAAVWAAPKPGRLPGVARQAYQARGPPLA